MLTIVQGICTWKIVSQLYLPLNNSTDVVHRYSNTLLVVFNNRIFMSRNMQTTSTSGLSGLDDSFRVAAMSSAITTTGTQPKDPFKLTMPQENPDADSVMELEEHVGLFLI